MIRYPDATQRGLGLRLGTQPKQPPEGVSVERRAPPPFCASLEFCLAHARAQGGRREAARGQEWEGKESKSAVLYGCASAVNF